ncbi:MULTISPECIES: hypothetical protein [Burkholderia]|nr:MULTISPECIES: hypothetical protein [Burkholderia]CAG2261999.1 hypothetical protein BCCR75389_00641 [Burkholderia cenocepacia]CAG2262142.1 hypothetical protein BCCR75386_00654 [Burkholderia cenocepacia]CAG2262245.1 hypothetical protein BCCR75388_00655 [Burkholderia cenocepacia]CAG2262321.1 hypothetical protein BCCR75387_00655 [Burkholderia cenocepacia]CAG2262333.1 hypothetical protein BCCR75384_00655 [Burkholderia cenocepacia]
MSDTRQAGRLAGTTRAGSPFRERPACGAWQRECVSQAARDIP